MNFFHVYKNTFVNYEFFLGGKSLLVFLHGWGTDISLMKPFAKNFMGNYSYLFIDFPPFGNSKEPLYAWNLTDYTNLTNEIIENVAIQNNFNEINLFGHSFGGRVAIKIASSNKFSNLKKLILLASAGIKPKFNFKTWFKIKLYKFYRKTNNKKAKIMGSADYKTLSPIMKQTFKNIIEENLAKNCKKITCKTLLIWGSKDTQTPLYMGKKLNKLISGSKLYVVKGANHFAYLNNFKQVFPVVLDFL